MQVRIFWYRAIFLREFLFFWMQVRIFDIRSYFLREFLVFYIPFECKLEFLIQGCIFLYFCTKMCHFLGSIFLPWDVSIFYHHVVAIGSIRNLDTWVLWYVNPKHISRGTLLSICKLLTYQTQKRIKHQTNSEFVMKIVWRKSIASLHRLTQAVQRANLRRTAGDPTWV